MKSLTSWKFALALSLAIGGALMMVVAASAHPTIDIVASNWKFTPAKISIPVNEPTTLRLTSSAGVHGLQSDELGIPKTTISTGSFQLVTFTPKKPGTYILHCAIVCGPGHQDMTLTVVVTASN
jgi:cytochrome c oxidase subunit II